MAIHRLTGRCLSKLPPGKIGDGHGLSLRVQPGGSRSWVWDGDVKDGPHVRGMGLGGFPLVTLKAARQKALELRRMARQGIDPRAAPRLPRLTAWRACGCARN